MDRSFDAGDRRRNSCRYAYSTRMSRGFADEKGDEWFMDIAGDAESIEMATSASSRLRGMLFRDPDDITRLLVPCRDVHTFGMRYPLDIAFISKDGYVLEVYRNVEGRRRIKRKEASMVAERFSRQGDWLKTGDVIRLGVPKYRKEK